MYFFVCQSHPLKPLDFIGSYELELIFLYQIDVFLNVGLGKKYNKKN